VDDKLRTQSSWVYDKLEACVTEERDDDEELQAALFFGLCQG